MKAFKFITVAALAAIVLTSCGPSIKKTSKVQLPKAQVDSVSYAMGVWFGNMIKSEDFGDLNFSKVNAGLADAMNDKVSREKAQVVMSEIQKYLESRSAKVGEYNKAEGEKFLSENGKKENVVTMPDGLQYQMVKEGTGVKPGEKDTVEVAYIGTSLDGKVFDSTGVKRPAKFPINRVIKGWAEGIRQCSEGGNIKIWIPSSLGYGMRGPAGANAVIAFDVNLIKVYPFDSTKVVAPARKVTAKRK
ncbi:MAG: FKBP-type peptidyl-prolyl cis-trans isomerase [Bacteroidales bacterium]|jgi:FKBP-type peptidyl-prolyl cis-trans isomerase|nr:FKBP-type peptidyl-prolyl cis-trans isomerase [Bacteroidales bacterium]MCI2122002.1 FKBP-type peptidyl-prolyl cis-trans isomerase [Bacteroidales bacterium]MCI2145194.1 FKBP-type peptidyl-prolyl cis-trans isomerase [Bacteroidales bacterium]